MNNRGFGLQEVLVFIGIFMFVLVAVFIYGKAKLSDNSSNQSESNKNTETIEPDYSNSLDELTPVDIEKASNEYIELEDKLKEATKHYNFDKSENIVISLKELQDEYLLGDLIDSSNIKCDGYVIYNTTNGNYEPYIKCGNVYTTTNFNEELLKK